MVLAATVSLVTFTVGTLIIYRSHPIFIITLGVYEWILMVLLTSWEVVFSLSCFRKSHEILGYALHPILVHLSAHHLLAGGQQHGRKDMTEALEGHLLKMCYLLCTAYGNMAKDDAIQYTIEDGWPSVGLPEVHGVVLMAKELNRDW